MQGTTFRWEMTKTVDPRQMMLDALVQTIEGRYRDSVAFVVVYGSYVTGQMSPKSDVDVVFVGKDARGLEVVCRQMVLVTGDREAAREAFRNALVWYFATPVYNKFAAWYGFAEEAALIAEGFRLRDRELTRRGMSDRFVDSIAVFGSLEECRERIAAYVAAGVTTTAISPLSGEPDAVREVIEGLSPCNL